MDRLQELVTFMHKLVSDFRLKPTHISLCVALCHAWVRSNFQNIFQVSRRKLMDTSRLQSRATYHKVHLISLCRPSTLFWIYIFHQAYLYSFIWGCSCEEETIPIFKFYSLSAKWIVFPLREQKLTER
jgi:hypothetical protein